MAANKTYAKIVHNQWDRVPVWLPNQKVDIGDFGTIDDKCFQRLGNIKKFKIDVEKRKSRTASLVLTSSGAYTVKSTINPPNVGPAKAEVKVDFQGDTCVIFQSKDCTSESIENLSDVNSKIVKLHKENDDQYSGGWDKGWYWVSEVVKAKPCIILGSFARGSSVTFTVNVPVTQIQGIGDLLNIGDLDVNLSASHSSDNTLQATSDCLTP
ncbi:MAG: hypothetical protein WBZ42_05600, partial [Halobacteriota archaeon]